MARRMVFIVVTDFLCWMPVIILSLLSLLGEFHDPEKQAYVWIAVFVLPVNSSINPILYTFSTPLMRKKFGQQRDSLRGVMERLGQRLKNFPGLAFELVIIIAKSCTVGAEPTPAHFWL